ncbi:MAG: HEPN domain-containing protein [Chloroflexi bacterium]|nr:HEPN domain-containing protein [Chloroflexota bacterium]
MGINPIPHGSRSRIIERCAFNARSKRELRRRGQSRLLRNVYAALALLITIDRESSKHQGVIALFDENFIKQNILPKELGKLLHRAFEMRQAGDYRDMLVTTEEQAADAIHSANKFLKAIEAKLSEHEK